MNPTITIAALTIKEAVRRRLLIAFVAITVVIVALSAWGFDRLSHAHNLTKRKWNPNLQRVRARVLGQVRNLDVCTRCLRGGKVEKAARGRRVGAPATA